MAEEPAWATVGRTSDYVTLAKPRLNLLVVATTLAGYYMAAPHGLGWALLLHTLVGTALVASGASAFNQLLEIEAVGGQRIEGGILHAPIDVGENVGKLRAKSELHLEVDAAAGGATAGAHALKNLGAIREAGAMKEADVVVGIDPIGH